MYSPRASSTGRASVSEHYRPAVPVTSTRCGENVMRDVPPEKTQRDLTQCDVNVALLDISKREFMQCEVCILQRDVQNAT